MTVCVRCINTSLARFMRSQTEISSSPHILGLPPLQIGIQHGGLSSYLNGSNYSVIRML